MYGPSKNIVLYRNVYQKDRSSFIEFKPDFLEKVPNYFLGMDSSMDVFWGRIPIDPSFEFSKTPEISPGKGIKIIEKNGNIEIECTLDLNVIEEDRIKGTDIFYKDGKIGISRLPLYTYKFDIAVPENTLMTAFHVGDGKYGFSMGNGTNEGFIPEIIGMGSDENDAGLYFIGKTSTTKKSGIPLVVIDGRRADNAPLKNRPIFGVTTGDYNNYKLIIDQEGRIGVGCVPEIYKMEVHGSIKAKDIVLEGLSVMALIDIIREHQEEIDKLKDKIESLEEQK